MTRTHTHLQTTFIGRGFLLPDKNSHGDIQMPKTKATAKLRMEDIPEYVKEKLRMDKLETEYRRVEREFNELVFQRGNPEDLEEQAMNELLDLDPEELAAKDKLSLTGMEAINEKMTNQKRKMIVLKKMVDAQKMNLDTAKGAAIRKIIPGYIEGYRDVVKRLAESVIAIGDAIKEEENYRREAESVCCGLASHLIPTPVRKIGKATDRFSYAHMYLNQAAKAGHIPESMIPEAR